MNNRRFQYVESSFVWNALRASISSRAVDGPLMLETILGYSPKRILKNIRPSASKIQGAQPAPDREDGAGCAPWISEAGDSFVHVSGCTKESGIPSSPSTHRQFTIQHAADVRLALVLGESVHTVAHPAKQLVESPVAYRGGCCTRRYAQRNAGPHRSADTSLSNTATHLLIFPR